MTRYLAVFCLVAFACNNDDNANQAEMNDGKGGNGGLVESNSEAAGSQIAESGTSGYQAEASGSQAGEAGLGASGYQAGTSKRFLRLLSILTVLSDISSATSKPGRSCSWAEYSIPPKLNN